jgi:transcriptional regulator with XRE-family HTH domain
MEPQMVPDQPPDQATRLRMARERQGLTQQQVGARFGVSHRWIGRLETTAARLSPEWLIRLSRAYFVGPDWIVFGDRPDPRDRNA